MSTLQLIAYILVAFGGLAVVLARDPTQQAMVLGLFGILLTILFLSLEAPDVALSELTIGSAALPLMLVVTASKVRKLSEFRACQMEADHARRQAAGGTDPHPHPPDPLASQEGRDAEHQGPAPDPAYGKMPADDGRHAGGDGHGAHPEAPS